MVRTLPYFNIHVLKYVYDSIVSTSVLLYTTPAKFKCLRLDPKTAECM